MIQLQLHQESYYWWELSLLFGQEEHWLEYQLEMKDSLLTGMPISKLNIGNIYILYIIKYTRNIFKLYNI